MRPFSGFVNRKKIVGPRSWMEQARDELGHARSSGTETGTYLENYIRKRFSSSLLSHLTYLCAFTNFDVSFSLLLCLLFPLSARFWGEMEFGNLPPLRLDLVCESPVLPLIVRYPFLSNVLKHVARII